MGQCRRVLVVFGSESAKSATLQENQTVWHSKIKARPRAQPNDRMCFMNKPTFALCFFVLGACCSFLGLSSLKVRADQASTIGITDSEPQVQPIIFVGNGTTVNGSVQQLDRFACNRCIINVPLLTYGGGAINIANCKLPQKSAIQLKGAALNTFNVLQSLGYLSPEAKTATLEIRFPDSVTLKALDGLKPSDSQ